VACVLEQLGQAFGPSASEQEDQVMTTPNERMRALRWGHELLAEMLLDMTLPEECRAQAEQLGRDHPSAHELVQWVQTGQTGLPPNWAAAIVETHEFFTRTRGRLEGSAATQRALLYALRHYPDPSTTQLMARGPGFSVWLELEQ
jgi:hypothetical protein